MTRYVASSSDPAIAYSPPSFNIHYTSIIALLHHFEASGLHSPTVPGQTKSEPSGGAAPCPL